MATNTGTIEDRQPVSAMQEILSLQEDDIFYVVRGTEPNPRDRGKKIKAPTFVNVVAEAAAIIVGGGGGGGGGGGTIVVRTAKFRGDGVTTDFTLPYTAIAPNELAVGSRPASYIDDYSFTDLGLTLHFNIAPEDPGVGVEDNIAITYFEDVSGFAFLKENQGLDSVLNVGNESDLDIILNGVAYVNRLVATNIDQPSATATPTHFVTVDPTGYMRRIAIGTGFNTTGGTLNAAGSQGVTKYMDNMTWDLTSKTINYQYSDNNDKALILTGLAKLTDMPTDFVSKSGGGKFLGKVQMDTDLQFTGTYSIIRNKLNRIMFWGFDDSVSFYAANSQVANVYATGFQLSDNKYFSIHGTEFIIRKNLASKKMMVLDTDDKVKYETIPSGGTLYTLPAATTGTRGGIRVGAGLAITGDVLRVTGNTADGNNYPTSLGFDINTGVLTLGIAGLSALTKNLDGRYLLITDYSPGGGGGAVAGSAGYIPVFDASSDGVGNTTIKYNAGNLDFEGGASINFRNFGGATYYGAISMGFIGATSRANSRLIFDSGKGIVTVVPGTTSLTNTWTWKLGGVNNVSDLAVTRIFDVEVGGSIYQLYGRLKP